MRPGPDVVVVGGGIVGAGCGYALAGAGARVRVCERAFVASGSSGACEGNVLAWDKEVERELPLALRSAELWGQLAQELPDGFEYDRKGSVVVAETEAELHAAAEWARLLSGHGVAGAGRGPGGRGGAEGPRLRPARGGGGGVRAGGGRRGGGPPGAPAPRGGVLSPADAQLEPRLATAALARAAVARGATLATGEAVE